jgi:hypothetical protein
VTLKRRTVIRKIRVTDDAKEIERSAGQVKGLVQRTRFLKKACRSLRGRRPGALAAGLAVTGRRPAPAIRHRGALGPRY